MITAAGCTVTPDDPPQTKRPGPAEEHDHSCTGACDHVYVDGGFRFAGHKHGPGCGHALVNGRWVKAPEPATEEGKKDPDPK
jgi:hypothetical protein